MPDWLQTVLVILAVVLVIYLIAVLAQIVLAKVLRRQAEPMRASVERAQREVAAARDKLDALAPAINGGTKEMPFGPLYDQARVLWKRGMASVNEVQSQLAGVAAREVAEQPVSSAFKLAPMSKEVAQRLSARRSVKTVSVYLTEVNDTLSRIQQIQADIDTVPRREKDALLQLQKRSAEVATLVEAETRPKRPLTEERDVLRQAEALIEQASKLLADAAPPQAAVIIAYPLRLKASEQLQSLDNMIAAVAEQRTHAEATLARSNERASALKASIAEDETNGFVRLRFAAQANALTERVAAARGMVEQGEYDPAMGALSELDKDIAAHEAAFAALTHERLRVTSLADKASQRLAVVTGWIQETPPVFELDITQAAAHQLQGAADGLRSLVPLEDVTAMAAAAELDAKAEDIFARASHVHDDFTASRRRFDDLRKTLNDESVQALVLQAANAAAELRKAHRNYWGNLTPEAITAAADELSGQWQALRGQLTHIRESALAETLGRMDATQATYHRASELHRETVRALAQLDADRLQAMTALYDAALKKGLADAEAIGAESPSLAEQPGFMAARVEALRNELQTPAPDFKTIHANAQRLRREVEDFTASYRQRLQHIRGQLGLLKYRLTETRDQLNQLNDDPRIDFAPVTGPVCERVQTWLAGFDAGLEAPLDAAQTVLADGETIEREATTRLNEATAARKSINDAIGPIKTAVAELNGTLSSAQAGLHAMADVGGERWGQAMLDPAREPLTAALEQLARLEQPAQKLSPEAARLAVQRVEALVNEARAHATEIHADIARRVAAVQERRDQLSQALSDGEAAAAADANRQDEWQLVRQQVSGLELRWVNATSYAEALEALTQAAQRAQRFVGDKRT